MQIYFIFQLLWYEYTYNWYEQFVFSAIFLLMIIRNAPPNFKKNDYKNLDSKIEKDSKPDSRTY